MKMGILLKIVMLNDVGIDVKEVLNILVVVGVGMCVLNVVNCMLCC